MSDLIWGFVILGGLAGLLFFCGRWIGAKRSIAEANIVAVLALLGLGAYLIWLRDNLLLATLLPFSNLIVIGNWLPLWLSLISGIAWSQLPRLNAARQRTRSDVVGAPTADELVSKTPRKTPLGVWIRRIVVVTFLQAIGWTPVIQSIWGSPPPCREQWEGDICIQTDEFTCSAACASTLLKAHGIDSTEAEMTRLCLTRKGTLWQGLYRGLKLKTAGTEWDVAVVSGSIEQLRPIGDGPAILAAGIPRGQQVPAIYTDQYGWTPGVLHSVLFFGFRENGLVAMGEPTPGVAKENWSEEDLRILWRGRGMRLVPRRGAPF